MTTWDWIVIGAGLAGSALSYELAKAGFSVLLLEKAAVPQNGTRFSYGGIAYWSGFNDLTRQLCQESIALHRQLSAELESDTQFQERHLLLTIDPDSDPETTAAEYSHLSIPPALLSPDAAKAAEPLLNAEAIAAALLLPHGHVSPTATVKAYNQAFERLGGKRVIAEVKDFLWQGDRILGVVTSTATYEAANVSVCAGGLSRALLKAAGLSAPVYFTQAEIIETPPVEIRLQTIVMPAALKRFAMEAEAGKTDALWDDLDREVVPPVLDIGAVQFQDGSLRIGQVSRTLTDPTAVADASQSQAELRSAIAKILPALESLPGQWCSCLVSFSSDRLPVVGALPQFEGLHLFAGFSNPFALLPPSARRFAQFAMGKPDELIEALSPQRFWSLHS
ncbi:FAD-binding oxidoreductase [Phormidium tenue FACHB-886]|nr:FAD-binding oxidoreductase [Phormidium tenue FACHB-886]